MNLKNSLAKVKSGRLYTWLLAHHVPVQLLLAVVAGITISKILTVAAHLLLHHFGLLPAISNPDFTLNTLLLALAMHSLFAVAGAVVTASLAGDQARKACVVLGTKEAIIWVLGLILLWKTYPAWFNLAKALLGIPLALLGGRIFTGLKRCSTRKAGQ